MSEVPQRNVVDTVINYIILLWIMILQYYCKRRIFHEHQIFLWFWWFEQNREIKYVQIFGIAHHHKFICI